MLAKVLLLSFVATSFALLLEKKRSMPTCKREEKTKRPRKSPKSEMRLVKKAEMDEPGYGDEPKLKQIFYINQDRAQQRRVNMERKLKAVKRFDIERFPAVKPQEARQLEKEGLKNFSTGYKLPEVNGKKMATYFSHWLILKHIANQTSHNASDHTDVYFVLEDDVNFKRNDWVQQVMCQISKLPADWDMYKFGYWDGASKERGGSCGWKDGKFKPMVDYNVYSCYQDSANVDITQFMGNQGYAIRPTGAQHMLAHLAKMPIMDVDGAMMPHTGRIGAAPNNYYSKETLLGHDTEVDMANVRNLMKKK